MSVTVFTATRPRQLSEVVKVEVHPDLCRESLTALAGQAFDLGQVIAKVAVSGKLVVLDPSKSDGSEVAYGVSQVVVDAGVADVENVVITRRLTVVSASGLRWAAGITDAQKATAIAQLDARGVVARNY